jgi:hypothetical protein
MRSASAISVGHLSASAAAATLSMTHSRFFSPLLATSVCHVDIASNAALTALRASSGDLLGMICFLFKTYALHRKRT